MFSGTLKNKLLYLFLILWALATMAALAGMYHLWWTREYRLYGNNKSISEQRAEVFRRAGISLSLLYDAEAIDRSWPLFIHYKAQGDRNQLSYVKYLLLPRVPSGDDQWVITEKKGRLYPNIQVEKQKENRIYPSNPRGFFVSLILLLGVAFLLKNLMLLKNLSLPEGIAAAMLFLNLSTVISRALGGNTSFGFWIVSVLGVCGGSLFLFKAAATFRDLTMPFMLKRQLAKGLIESRAALLFLILVSALALLWSVLMSVIVVPDDWDAWAIWGAKAKVLALGLGPLNDVTYFDHADYPLLWPSLWAFSGWCAGGWEEHWSRAWGAVIMILSAWQIGIVVRHLTDKPVLGAWTSAAFLSIPMVALLATWSYAEAPLWLMLSCSFGRLVLWRKEKTNQYLLIAALFAAGAAYTKNEGVLFAAVCTIWITLINFRDWRTLLRSYALPFSLLYLPWFLWIRGVLGLGNHAFEGFQGGAEMLARILDRIPTALKSIAVMWIDIRQWNIILWIVLALSLFHLCRSRANGMDLFVPLAMLFAFFVINVFHMQEIGLLMSSWNRLTTQTLPMFLMILGARYLPVAVASKDP